MSESLSGRFEIDAKAETRLASVQLLLSARNSHEGEQVRFNLDVLFVEITRGSFHLRIPAEKFGHLRIEGRRASLRDGRFLTEPVTFEIRKVYLGYDLRAELRMDGNVADDFDSYSGQFTFGFALRGPAFLPDFSDERCVGSFAARRVPEGDRDTV